MNPAFLTQFHRPGEGGAADHKRRDRYYSYDHAGRLKAYLHPYPTPSDQAFSYDEFDHMTVRANGSWRYYTDTGSDYQNNRNIYTISVPGSYPSCCPPQPSYWTYNADGEVLHDHNKEYTYDAAGNKTLVFETSQVGISLTKRLWIYQDYDGDGVRAKRVEQQQFNQGPYSFKTSYYLRSSVVDGNLLIELNESGQQREHFVYAGGEILAKQKDNQVRWIHVDPVTNSTRETSTDGTLAERLEFDPLGNDIPLTDPNSDEPPDYLFVKNYDVSGNPYDGPSGCTLDGQPMPCSLATGLINIGAAGICPNNICGPRFNGAEWEFLQFDENGMYYGRQRIAYQEKRRASQGTQRPQQRRQDPNQTVIDLVTRTFAEDDCFQFLKAVLNKASTKSNPVLKGGDIRAISQDFLTQTNGSLSREKVEGARYGSAKGTIRSDGKGNAVIYRGLAASGSQDEYDAIGIVAELPHLAGSKGGWPRPEYHDLDLARGAFDAGYDSYFRLKTVPNPFSKFPDRRSQEKNRGSLLWSSYFHDIMNRFCDVPKAQP